MQTLLCCLLAGLFFTVAEVKAEELKPLAGKEGKWSFSMNEPGADLKSVSKEKQQKIKAALQDITRLVTETPAMKPPKGFEARFWGTMSANDRYDSCRGKKCPPAFPTATLTLMLGRYEEKNSKVKAAFNTPSTMDISINNMGQLFAHLPVLYKDADGYLLPEPQPDGERAKMKTFSNNGHAITVVTGNEQPLWLPVSRERYLKAAIAAAVKDAGADPVPENKSTTKQTITLSVITGKPVMIEESRTWIDPAEEKKWVESSRSLVFEMKEPIEVLRERIIKFQAELATMPPEQRAMQAKVAIAGEGGIPSLLPPESSSGTAVVTPNFNYFNSKLPVEAIQLIVVQWKFDGNPLYDPEKSGITETVNNRKLLEIYKTMDWEKLKSKVTRTVP